MSVSRPQPGTILPGGLAAFPIDYDGCIILGCPAGILQYRQREASRLLPAVLCLPSWSALPLIRQFISARVGYLARISELETNISAFLDFDPKIDAAIHFIAGVTAREATASFWLLPTIRSLPLSLFGLGVPSFAASPLSTPPSFQSSPRSPLSFPRLTSPAFSTSATKPTATTLLRIAPRLSVTEFRTSRSFTQNSGSIRADCGFITSTDRRYIDMTASNPAAPNLCATLLTASIIKVTLSR